MALRVLLADESVTIKKVIQLALQDFAVEVKAVPVGLDVLEVSKTFKPDLVFADVLLQKRSGYEVCRDLKKDPDTAAVPVVLMWSSFMEIDQAQLDSAGADGKLEKPFEVDALRKLVVDLVPRTRSQRLAHFLEFPPTIAAPLKNEEQSRSQERKQQTAPPPPPKPAASKPTAPEPATNSAPIAPPPATPSVGGFEPPTPSSLTPLIPDRPEPASTVSAKAVNPGSTVPDSLIANKSQLEGAFQKFLESNEPAKVAESSIPTATIAKPAKPSAPPELGALPDLQLDTPTPSMPSKSDRSEKSTWNMESFEDLDKAIQDSVQAAADPNLPGPRLELEEALESFESTDPESSEDEVADSFRPLNLPQPSLNSEKNSEKLKREDAMLSDFSMSNPLADDDDDAEDWAPQTIEQVAIDRSPSANSAINNLDKYRIAPLKPEEAMALDDESKLIPPAFSSAPQAASSPQDLMQAEPSPSKTFEIISDVDGNDVPELSISEEEFDKTLEIEPISQEEHTRPSIVRELLRDPDFSIGGGVSSDYDPSDITEKIPTPNTFVRGAEGAVDLASVGLPSHGAGRPLGRPTREGPSTGSFRRSSLDASDAANPALGSNLGQNLDANLDSMIRSKVEPAIEAIVERVVSQILPQIAEKIINRELKRLLEESDS